MGIYDRTTENKKNRKKNTINVVALPFYAIMRRLANTQVHAPYGIIKKQTENATPC